MAHTDRHRPYRVQEADPLETHWYRGYGGSRWFLFNTCSCRWHSMYHTRIAENRQRRHDDQRRARWAVKGVVDAWDQR